MEEEKPKELTSKQQAVRAVKMVENLKKRVPVRHQQITVIGMAASMLSNEEERVEVIVNEKNTMRLCFYRA